MPKTVRINVPQQMYSDTEEVVDDGSHALHTYVPGNELEHVTTVDNALFCADISDDECRRNSVRSRETPAVDGQKFGLSHDGCHTDDSLAPTNQNHTLSAASSKGLGIRDLLMQLSPELSRSMHPGEFNREGNSAAPDEALVRVASMPEDLAVQELPTLLTILPDEVMTPSPAASKAAARWKKGNVAVTANRFLRGVKPGSEPTEEVVDPATPQNQKELIKKRKKPKKVKHPNIVKKADPMTELLRVGWSPKNNTIPAHSDEVHRRTSAARQKIQLLAEDALKAGPVTLWDVLSGKVASRIPNLNVGPRAPWSGWDPCSKYRSSKVIVQLFGRCTYVPGLPKRTDSIRWDALCCLLVFYMALTLPVEVAFVTTSPGIDAWSFISYCIDALFVADIYIHFRTGYFQQEKETGMWSLQLDPKACAFRYMRGWFIVDLLSVVPFEPLLPSPKGLGINLSQLPRCLKLLRLPRLFRYIKKWQELIPVSSILMQLSTTICVMMLFAHVAACTLVLAAKLEGLPDGSWMVQYDLTDKTAFIQYLYALFNSTSHLFCLGYGLPTIPGSLVELCVTLVSMIVGSVLFLVVVGTLPTAILEQEVSAAAQELEGDHVPLPTARAAHDRARLASMVGMFSPAFRSSVMHSAAMHENNPGFDGPQSAATTSHKASPQATGAGRGNTRRGRRTTFAARAHLHHEQNSTMQPTTALTRDGKGEIHCQD